MKAWGDEVGLSADLLSDTDRSVAVAYGAAESPDQERPKRVSILIDADGKVAKIYDGFDAETHPAEVLDDLT